MNNTITRLDETVEMMVSGDYKERFKGEYYQLKIRFESLNRMLKKWDEGKLDFTPTCSRNVYDRQTKAMADYLDVLKARAITEQIDLE